jgi:hypothetical protein
VELIWSFSPVETRSFVQETFLGFPLFDRDATIIHHFAFFNNPSSFHYPYVRAGVAFSVPLLHRSVIHHTATRVLPLWTLELDTSPSIWTGSLIDLRFFTLSDFSFIIHQTG